MKLKLIYFVLFSYYSVDVSGVQFAKVNELLAERAVLEQSLRAEIIKSFLHIILSLFEYFELCTLLGVQIH